MYLSLISLFKKNKKTVVSKKKNSHSCEGRMEKSVPRDHRLSSLGKPRDAKRRSSGRIFYPHTHDRFLYSSTFNENRLCCIPKTKAQIFVFQSLNRVIFKLASQKKLSVFLLIYVAAQACLSMALQLSPQTMTTLT